MSKAIEDLISDRFGIRTRSAINRENITVTTTSQIVFRSDPSRLAFTIINLHTAPIFLRPQGIATTGNGITVGANGGSVAVTFEEDLILASLEWQVIASAATAAILTIETLIEAGGE